MLSLNRIFGFITFDVNVVVVYVIDGATRVACWNDRGLSSSVEMDMIFLQEVTIRYEHLIESSENILS